MASKQNDLMLNILANPHMNLGDFQSVGLSADNTSLEDEKTYLNSTIITENPLFQNASGEFDKVKFHQKYLEAAQALQNMSLEDNQKFTATYSKYNIFAPLDQTDFSPQYELVKALNPDRLTKSMLVLGQSGPREKTPAEIAQSQKILNSETGELMDTPEDMFSFGKLFSDLKGFFSDNFESTKVLATYDEDVDINGIQRGENGFNENLIEHYKGEYKLNDNGTYYYRTLKTGEDIYGKQILHYSDILTKEGSVLNSVDFLDSDDIHKTPFGSFVKDASLIGAFFLPYVGPAIAGATIFQQAAGLGATLGKIALGSNSPTMNWIEGLVQATNPMETRSEHSQQTNWTIENLLGMTGDVIGQLYQQRLLFKYAPAIFKGKWGISEQNQEALKAKILEELEAQNKKILGESINTLRGQKIATELHANAVGEAAAQVEKYMKSYYKVGEELSKAYMTMLTVNDIYGEAKAAGAADFDAAVITAGYAAMEYALLSTDIGKWVLPELRAQRLQDKAMLKALSKPTLEAFDKLGKEAGTSEAAKRTYLQKLIDFGKSIAKGEFASGIGKRASIEGGTGLLAGDFQSLIAGATAEAVEETSEELLADFSRVLYNGLEQLRGKESRLKPFENAFDRYSMSFLGGFLGGGVSSATFDFSEVRKAVNMNYNQAMQQLIYKARNNDLGGIYKLLDSDSIGNEKLSAKKIITDENGTPIWQQAEGNDNQDFVIKQNVRRQLDLIQNTLNAHGGNKSDQSLLEAQTLGDIRFRALYNSTTAGQLIQHYNELITELVDTTQQLNNLNSAAVKAEANEGDQKNEKSPDLEKNRKQLEEKIKDLDKQIDDYNSGKLAPLFMTSALLETTPFLSASFMNSTFRYFAEDKAKTKFENIPEKELEKYLIEYQEYLRTSKKDDLRIATQGYLSLARLIKDNFQETQKLAQDSLNDTEINDYLQTFNETLSTFSQNLGQMDDDTWVEKLQEFAKDAKIGDKLFNQLQLLKNTMTEGKNLSEEKRSKMVKDANQAFESGQIDEETRNNTIAIANQEYDKEIRALDELHIKQQEEILMQGQIQGAQNLADKILKLGYINGAIKSRILAQLQDAVDSAIKYSNKIIDDINYEGVPGEQFDNYLNLSENLSKEAKILSNKIENIKKLSYTPILQNLDTFALNVNGGNISGLLEGLGKQIDSNRGNLSSFTLQGDTYKQLNEALRVVDLYISALEGARTDTVDPFRVGMNAKGEAIDRSNIWGINKTLNEIHAKSPKIENDTWQDLPEIEGKVADMMLLDARSIKKLLLNYKRLFNINEGQKLNVQTRVATKTSYLLYDRIKRLLNNIDLDKEKQLNTSELRQTIESLSKLNELTSGKKEDWNLNLSQEEQTQIEKERIQLEDAIYNFFNNDNPGLSTDIEKLKIFLNDNFKLLSIKSELLSVGATDIDETSIVGYIASKAAIKSSDFHGKYKEILDGKIAPIISQEIGVSLQLANVLNGSVISAFTQAYREVLVDKYKNSSYDDRVKMLEEYGASKATAEILATKTGSKYYSAHDSVPQFDNITFIDGIPGAGKSAAVDALVIKFLQRYYPNLTKNVWTCHGGDNESSEHPFTDKFRKDIGLVDSPNQSFSKVQLMKKISQDWTNAKTTDGKTYQITESDFIWENGRITPSWKLNNIEDSELPSIIIIDEGQQFTQFDLMLIDKFAKQHGIPVIMSGDLQQSKAKGEFTPPTKEIQTIIEELKEQKKTELAEGLENVLKDPNQKNLSISINLTRNQTLHTPKLGTSMRTANNQKDANQAALEAALEEGKGNITLHYYEDDTQLTGDIIITPNDIDKILKYIDKIIVNLKEGEQINYAYSKKDSKIYEILSTNKKYSDRINFIQGTALGQEGNFWIVEPDYSINSNGEAIAPDSEDFISDLYTVVTRSKVAGLVISPSTFNGGQITLNNTQDQETHKIEYSPQAIEKYAQKRKDILNNILGKTNDISYIPRQSNISTPDTKEPEEINPVSETTETQKPDVETPPSSEPVPVKNKKEPEQSSTEDVQELISFDVFEEKEAKRILEEATFKDNPKADEEIEPNGLSISTFNFFLFSNAVFELGTTNIDEERNTYQKSPIKNRIDCLNGIENCPALKKCVGNLSASKNALGIITRSLLTISNKSELEKFLSEYLFKDKSKVYVRYAIKTSEREITGINKTKYFKLEKEETETLPYARAQENTNSESNYVNPRNLVAIIGTEENGDAIELPVLTLNNPITLLKIKDKNNKYKFSEAYETYINVYNAVKEENGWKAAQIAGLQAVLQTYQNNPDYKGLLNLITLYIRTDRNIVFIPDKNWTPSNNLHCFGPQLHKHRGEKYFDEYDNEDYIQETKWISLDTLRADPTLVVSDVYQLLDKAEQNLNLAQPKHPFILYTDSIYDHTGKKLLTQSNLIEEYMYQKQHPEITQSIKLVYVLPPTFTFREYINSLHQFMDVDKKSRVLGNQRTAYKILEILLTTDSNAVQEVFKEAVGEETGQQMFNKISELISRIKDLSVAEQVKELQKVETWPNFNGIGLTTKTNVYKHLQHIIKQLVFPGGVDIEGRIHLKNNGQSNEDIFNRLNQIFEKSNQKLFYQVRANKDSSKRILGIFTKVQTDNQGHINDPNIAAKEFQVNGNLSSSTFLAEEDFNLLLQELVTKSQYINNFGMVTSVDTKNYIGIEIENKYPKGYSGWTTLERENTSSQQSNPAKFSISNSIMSKLTQAGLNTSIAPSRENDNSIELKQAIAEEINNNRTGHIATVLPNGELVIGSINLPIKNNIKFIYDNNPFESNQQYQFEAEIDGDLYDIIYDPITKKASFQSRTNVVDQTTYNFDSYYEEVTPQFIEDNLNRYEQLLQIIANEDPLTNPVKNEDLIAEAQKLLKSKNPEDIAAFFNNAFGIMAEIAEMSINDFDKASFTDILKFEQVEEATCKPKFNVQFI